MTALHHTLLAFLQLAKYLLEEKQFKYILFGKFQTDDLEFRFGQYRQMSGSNYYVSVQQSLEGEKKLKLLSSLRLVSASKGSVKSKDIIDPLEKVSSTVTPVTCDQDFEKFIPILNECDEVELSNEQLKSLVFIAGYCARKAVAHTDCDTCKSDLRVNERLNVEVTEECLSYLSALDRGDPEQVFICKGVSSIGASAGSILTVKFAFFEPDTVIIESASSTFNLCGDTNYTNNQLPTICRVPKDKIYPAPTFSFSEEGLTFDVPQKGRAESMFYLRQFYPSPAIGGVYQVSCRVANTVTGKTQERRTPVTVLKPPLLPPKITIRGKTYQGSNALNRITLAAGYTGDMTCRVEGGYPKAHTTQLTCGSLTASGEENVATLTFQDGQLNKDLDGTECRCTSQHVTGCYNNKEKSLTLDVTYAPVVTFTHNSASSEFNERDTPTFTCAAQGNPPPNLTITRKRTEQQLASIQRNLKTTELIHTLNPLDCLDTDVYVCTGQNNQDVTINEIIVGVKCPQQLASNTSQPETGEVVVGETVQLGLEIYGYPTPHLLTLMRARDGTNLTGSARHLIEFSLRQAPFGVVNVTISDVVEEDFTNYTIIVDNGEGEPLLYPFYLLKIEQEERKDNTVAIAVGVTIAVVVALGIVVILVVLVLRHSKARKSPLFQPAKENRYVDIFPDPADGYEVPVTQSEGEGMRPGGHTQVRINAYEEIDPTPANGYEMSDGPVQEEGHKGFRVNHYEEINPRIVNEYEVPNALVQEEDMRPKDETVQQSYTNCISSQQDNNETKDTKDNSYSNLGFDVGKEKCVYVNTEDRSQQADGIMRKREALLVVLCLALLVSTSMALPIEQEEEKGVQKRIAGILTAITVAPIIIAAVGVTIRDG
ncbi:transposable element p transposase [Plakobranchus ocellatus]|uniref:Transposable element p transposase n=1 Tax=Plakobranchus ocellatus TaxID=259542 RepID=A0AAV4AL12_9GAST|nr:transposable element p transposase [Plakobranchus ocellatus]